jgi:uncharacterized protein YcfJ
MHYPASRAAPQTAAGKHPVNDVDTLNVSAKCASKFAFGNLENNMHFRVRSCLAVATTLAAAAAAAHDFTDLAPVVAVTPIMERVNVPRQECWNETVSTTTREEYREGDRSYGGAIVGGIAGGLIGNQVGGGTGRTAATAAGAVVGALVGDNIDNSNRGTVVYSTQPQTVQRCRTIDQYRDEARGYNVTYRYNGRDVTVRLPYDPGPNVRIGVSVLDDRRSSYR